VKLNYKHIILGVIILCFIVLSTTFSIGKSHNIKSEIEFENYTYAVELIQSNEAEKAIGILKQLDEQYPENVFIKRYLGLAYTSTGDSSTGASYFQECLAINPAIQLDVVFMLQYGETLYYNGEYEKAKVVSDMSLQLNNVESYKNRIDNLISMINEKRQITKVTE
jgi:tetratricopeptide (TPR) repeat protein